MLDSPTRIKELDSRGMLDMVAKMPEHLSEGHRTGVSTKVGGGPFGQIVVCGLGGSAIGGDLVSSWLSESCGIPCHVVRSYSLPAFVAPGTLVIVVSYSGDTEETLSMMADAMSKGGAIVTVSSGGRLKEISAKEAIPHCVVPPGLVPRATVGCVFGAVSGILEGAGVISSGAVLEEACDVLGSVSSDCGPRVDTSSNPAKKLAHLLHGTIPVAVGYGLSAPVAKRWANQFNENAKMVAFDAVLPEMDHNGIVGWVGDGRSQGFSMVFLDHEPCDRRMVERVDATKRMLGERLRVFSSNAVGSSPLSKMLSLVMVGDYTSIYAALLRGEDPSTTEPIDELKRILSKKGE